MKTESEIIKEYEMADKGKRENLWFLYRNFREIFNEMEYNYDEKSFKSLNYSIIYKLD